MSNKKILTGVKPTGIPHIGNYFGTIEPALQESANYDESFLFIANYHALNQVQNSDELKQLTLSIAATWLACGLAPDKTHLYAQSDIPEIFELQVILNSFTPKGWMNKAHAYKAANDKNQATNKPQDDGINMGLYNYPILMAADILIFQADMVPVGKDQIQHVEIARDIAQKINSSQNTPIFTLPEHKIAREVGTVTGTDGRKMSKSYNNIIELFDENNSRIKSINKIVTDSSAPNEAKQVEGNPLLDLFKLVATPDETSVFRENLANGQVGWGDAKKQLAEKMDDRFSSINDEYFRLMNNPEEIRQTLKAGAENVRPIAQANLANIREVMGII